MEDKQCIPPKTLFHVISLSNGCKYTFNLCTWNSCGASRDAGGALKCTGTATKLYLESCSFTSYSPEREGGTIHASSIHTLNVKKSLFSTCSTSPTTNNQGSGTIWIYKLHHKLSLSAYSLISCVIRTPRGAFL